MQAKAEIEELKSAANAAEEEATRRRGEEEDRVAGRKQTINEIQQKVIKAGEKMRKQETSLKELTDENAKLKEEKDAAEAQVAARSEEKEKLEYAASEKR